MNPVLRMFLKINIQMLRLSWELLALLLALHFVFSWVMLAMFRETALIAPDIFYYFYIVTASTVGYGDLSPQTHAGQMIVSLFMIPGGVILFAAVVGKITTILVNAWRQNMKGQLDFSSQLEDHLVLMGWHGDSTSRMIELIFGDLKRVERDIVLVTTREMENPDPERLYFVQTDTLSSEDAWKRAGLASASRIIITGDNDDNTLTTALSLVACETRAHIVCHFEEREMAKLLRAHAPEVECHISNTTEMLVRSAQDPGSSRVQNQLINTLSGPTQFSLKVPGSFTGCDFNSLIIAFKKNHDALALGLADSIHGDDLILNPPGHLQVCAGQLIYFMSQHRLLADEINWNSLQNTSS